jgi:hypothetical protein
MTSQLPLIDLREETRPLVAVVNRRQSTESQWRLLLECGHSVEGVSHARAEVKRVRCTACGAYGDDDNGRKYKVPE